jgi:hypothetical protein
MTQAATAQARTPLLPDDVLTAILALAKKKSGEERLAFRGHDYTLQKVFRQLGLECHSRLLEPFVFSESGPEPYSPTLNEAVSRLQLSGLVGRENPDYEILFLRPSAEKYFQEELQGQFSDEEVRELQGLAQRFLQLVSLR